MGEQYFSDQTKFIDKRPVMDENCRKDLPPASSHNLSKSPGKSVRFEGGYSNEMSQSKYSQNRSSSKKASSRGRSSSQGKDSEYYSEGEDEGEDEDNSEEDDEIMDQDL